MEKYDVIVIGGGPAGYKAAFKLAAMKKNVCLVEKNAASIGGTCLNEGCIPVKSYAESAKLYRHALEGSRFGIEASVKPVDMARVRAAAWAARDTLVKGLQFNMKSLGLTQVYGEAVFTGKNSVAVKAYDGTDKELTASKFIIATGSVSKSIPGIPVDGKKIVTSRGLLDLEKLPERLLVIGGGVIGCEFASLFGDFGTKVTIVELLPSLLPGEDDEAVRTLAREFGKKGIGGLTGAKVEKIGVNGNKVHAAIAQDNGERLDAEFDTALVAVGRAPNTSVLGLDNAGVTTDRGYISVNEYLETSVPGIYAAGDVISLTPMYAHTAYREGVVAAMNCAGMGIKYDPGAVIPRIVFTEPQIGCAGMTEQSARAAGRDFMALKHFFKSNGRAVIAGSDAGFAKLLVENGTRKLLGACVVGIMATEIIHEAALAIEAGLTIDVISHLIHGHPTIAEILGETAE